MKKFSMGMMLSSLLLIQVGCGEEAPPVATPPDPSAMMSHAAGAASHSAAPATETPATETPATETPATETPATETPATETPAVEPVKDAAP